MVDQELLQAISHIFDAKLASVATKDDMQHGFQRSEKLMLDEMERLHNNTNERFEKLDKHLLNMNAAINSTRYSNETVELLLKKVEELEERLRKLEKTA